MNTGRERLDLIERTLLVSKNGTAGQGIALQKELSSFIEYSGTVPAPRFIAGVDLAYHADWAVAVILVLDNRQNEIERVVVRRKVEFPYVPGLLTYREFPAFWDAYQQLKTEPDVFIFDGQGLAHPRRMGIAVHAGILINSPTIGCAKSPLYGDYHLPGSNLFDKEPITINDVTIGYVIRTRENVKPVFVSSGYVINPMQAAQIVTNNVTRFKLPLATHLADKISKLEKRILFNDR